MKKILLVADVPNWIFAAHCEQITKRLSHKYEFETIFQYDVSKIDSNIYDACYVLENRLNFPKFPREKTMVGIRCEFCYQGTEQGAKIVYHQMLPKASILHTVNMRQFEQFSKCELPQCKVIYAPHGYDETLFYPTQIKNWPIIKIGSAGNPGSGGGKGFNIIQEACLKIGISPIFALKNISKKNMPDFYSGMDIYCCMSDTEGLNNGIMEAAACGCCIVATSAGGVPESICNLIDGFIVSRNIDSLTRVLEERIKDQISTRQFGQKIMEKAKNEWAWSVRINRYEQMFDQLIGA